MKGFALFCNDNVSSNVPIVTSTSNLPFITTDNGYFYIGVDDRVKEGSWVYSYEYTHILQYYFKNWATSATILFLLISNNPKLRIITAIPI